MHLYDSNSRDWRNVFYKAKTLAVYKKNLYTSTAWSHRRKLLCMTTAIGHVSRKDLYMTKSVVTQAKTVIRDHVHLAWMYHEGLESAWRLAAAGIGTVIWI